MENKRFLERRQQLRYVMKANIIHIISILAIAWLSGGCSEADPPVPEADSKARLVLSCAIGNGDVATKVEEDGWYALWNENLIKRLDLFVFRNTDFIGHHGEDITFYKSGMWTFPLEKLLVADNVIQAGDSVFIVANRNDVSDITTLAGLKGKTADGLICYEKQESFLMDGKTEVTESMLEGVDIDLGTVNLKRAAAKIRIGFSSESKVDWENGISYRLYHYTTSTNILDMGLDTEDKFLSGLPRSIYPEENVEIVDSDSENFYKDDDNEKLILYSYVNNWFDESKAGNINQEEPIFEDKQTYILLRAPYPAGSGNYYYYKIPVNKRLPSDNDDINLDPDTYRHLYRLQRNHLYDITVTIDREGGTEDKPVELENLEYHVAKWDEIVTDVPSFN